MKNQFNLLFATFISVLHFVTAQQTVTGVVSDENGTPLPGASVIVKGTDNGVTTDFDGAYQISVSDSQTLVFSYVVLVRKYW